ncbi:MAG: hypothetical protein JO307_21900 [Bryobacterales bacterium]|nr:hypothetical protein [Bryobacterales bacterium]
MRTTISLPGPLFENAKNYAEEHHITVSALIEDALRCHLAQKPPLPLEKIRLPTMRGKLVNPNLDLNRTCQILMDEEAEHFLDVNARR